MARITEAIHNRHISQGPITRQFEEKLAETLGVPYVVCTTSGTTALTMALLACGIGPGDEVIVPNRTWIATAHAVMMTGAKVVLCDTKMGSPVIDLADASAKVTARTKAFTPVHLNGRTAGTNLDPIPEISDACQAFPFFPMGPRQYQTACYSLSVAKIISTGQGGFCATRDEALYKELKALRTHDVADAMVPQVLEWKRFGYNFRFTDIQAAIGLAQLERLPERLQAISEIHGEYKANGVPVCETPTPLYNELLHPEPEILRAFLLERGIEARPIYPSLHTAPYLNATGEFPNSKKWASGVILPSGPCQKIEDIRRVCRVIEEFNDARYC